MKFIDRYVVSFAMIMAVATLLFRWLLSGSLLTEHYMRIWVYAGIYSVGMFCAGWLLGRAHSLNTLRFDIGLPFNAAGFLAWCATSYLWFGLGFSAPNEPLFPVHLGMGIWAVLLAIHTIVFLILRRDTIRGMHTSELFS